MNALDKIHYRRVLIETLEKSIVTNGRAVSSINEIDLNLPLDAYIEDSLERLEFIMALEDALGIVFDYKKIAECKSLTDIVILAES